MWILPKISFSLFDTSLSFLFDGLIVEFWTFWSSTVALPLTGWWALLVLRVFWSLSFTCFWSIVSAFFSLVLAGCFYFFKLASLDALRFRFCSTAVDDWFKVFWDSLGVANFFFLNLFFIIWRSCSIIFDIFSFLG